MAQALGAAKSVSGAGDARLLDARALAAETAAWDSLSANAAEPNVFAASWTLAPALARFSPDWIRIACAYDADGAMIGLAAVAPGVRRGLPLSHVETWRHDYSFFGAPLLRRGVEAEALRMLVAAAASHPCRPSTVRFGPFDAAGPVAAAFARLNAVRVAAVGARPLWTADAAEGSSAKSRSERRRRRRRLAEKAGLTLRVLSDEDDLDDWLAEFFRLEASGWKGSAGTAMAKAADAAAYAGEIARAARRRGALRFLRLDSREATVAMTINFVENGAGWGFKSAYDERFARYAPGVLLVEDLGAALAEETATQAFDSCAAPGGAADRVWAGRRRLAVADVGVTSAGRLAVAAARLARRSAAAE